jgi:hypothetical protein
VIIPTIRQTILCHYLIRLCVTGYIHNTIAHLIQGLFSADFFFFSQTNLLKGGLCLYYEK